MKLDELKKTEIQRKTNIPDDVRTPDKDEVADYIQNEIINEGRWPMDVIEIADEVDYSRQHVTNVVKEYFQPANAEDSSASGETHENGEITITVPKDLENMDSEEAFWTGIKEARKV